MHRAQFFFFICAQPGSKQIGKTLAVCSYQQISCTKAGSPEWQPCGFPSFVIGLVHARLKLLYQVQDQRRSRDGS